MAVHLTLQAQSYIVTDDILNCLVVFRENKISRADNSQEMSSLTFSEK